MSKPESSHWVGADAEARNFGETSATSVPVFLTTLLALFVAAACSASVARRCGRLRAEARKEADAIDEEELECLSMQEHRSARA
mmetsp:Transcript_139478/g.445140  ORF Transcript_139478/g.445140 Transcript_139478/m.445140 type:complete len:84 (-) Transcript_139478:102-353(-)